MEEGNVDPLGQVAGLGPGRPVRRVIMWRERLGRGHDSLTLALALALAGGVGGGRAGKAAVCGVGGGKAVAGKAVVGKARRASPYAVMRWSRYRYTIFGRCFL